jgi:hypothetical protein
MKDTYFLQYFTDAPWFEKDKPMFHFHNGFSAAYHNLKNKGDFIWLKSGTKLSIESGIVYASLMYDTEVKSLMDVARQNPNIEIHIGGPMISIYDIKKNNIPNFITHPQIMVEELFNINYDPNAWGLELPYGFKNIGYNFSLVNGTGCSWAKCNFCKRQNGTFNYKERIPDREIPIIKASGTKYIWIRTATINPDFLRQMPYRKDVVYCSYIRGDEFNYKKLKKADLHPGMQFSIGVELPSNRMLKYVCKGSTIESLTKTIKLLRKNKCKIHISLMLGFNNFNWDDIEEAKRFFSKDFSDITASIYYLTIIGDRTIYYNPPGPIKKQSFAINSEWNKTILDFPGMYQCVLNDEQWQLNNTLYKIYINSGLQINFDGWMEKNK